MHLVFDLDGVLVEFRAIHRTAYIQAWNTLYPDHPITDAFHNTHLEARSTRQKIILCSNHFRIPVDDVTMFNEKQRITERLLADAPIYTKTREALTYALQNNHTISCCSNSIRKTVEKALLKLVQSLDVFRVILSSDDVAMPKPAPIIYERALELLGGDTRSILVYEDSPVGRVAAEIAGLRVISIHDALDITPRFLEHTIATRERPMPQTINVVIPMAGLGSRFQAAGYTTAKPFLPIFGVPMYRWVIQNVVPESLADRVHIHILVREEHAQQLEAEKDDDRIHVHTLRALTEGAACTVLTIADIINNDTPLVIANSDQYLEWDAESFYMCLGHPEWDGVISTFEQPDPTDLRWSYATVSDQGNVTQVAEKQWIGPLATTGIYGWARGSDFVAHARAMIAANTRVNNEFYVCPVYNEGIARGQRYRTHVCQHMWGLGVPYDYEAFLAHWRPEKSENTPPPTTTQ